MTLANRKRTDTVYLDDDPVSGTMVIIAPIIIGVALIAGVYILFQEYERKQTMIRMAEVEEEMRLGILDAYRQLRSGHPGRAEATAESLRKKLTTLNSSVKDDSAYTGFAAVLGLIEAETLFGLDSVNNAALAEDKYTHALSLMQVASGEIWELGLLGRARTRLQLGKYEEAEADLNVLLARNPNYGAGFYWRALARAHLRDSEGMIADMVRAKNLDSWPPLRSS